MTELIKINQELIGTEEVNSVNARELWENLEIKKQFGNWIKSQIDSLGLEENIDFVTFNQKVKREGNTNLSSIRKDYIITLDTAKHISMASRTQKGKEVRKYFISCEKKLLTQGTNVVPAIIELQKTNQAILSNMTEMNKGLHQMLATMMNTKSEVSQIKSTINDDRRYMRKLDQGLDNIGYQLMGAVKKIQNVLKPEELDHIRSAIDKRAKELSYDTGEKISTITRTIYSYLNGKFEISSYYHLQSDDFLRALKIIDEIEIR